MDTTNFARFLELPPDMMVYAILVNFGWIPIAWVILWGAKELWMHYIWGQWAGRFKKIFLAIDIPRGNSQTIEAVENLMTYFAGAHSTFNLIDTYWDGKLVPSFSFEIVSIDGYTQFIIKTNSEYRNLVESAIYSQYPDAEITEVEDYTTDIPNRYPDDEWDIWGAEFVPVKHWAYPIRTYKYFQAQSGKPDEQFKDPMASLMDLCSSLRKGEQLWYQIIVTPEGFDWPKTSENEIKKILGESTGGSGIGLFSSFFSEVKSIFDETTRQIADMIFDLGGSSGEEKTEEPFRMMNLKPTEKKRVEAISEKASKLGFNCKQRFIYVAKKDVMNKPKVVNGFVGYMKQFIDMDLNNFKPDLGRTATSAEYFFIKSQLSHKKNSLMQGYKDRDRTLGGPQYVLTIDELATLWHFPLEAVVKAPLVQKAPGRKAKPPVSLPTQDESQDDSFRTFDLNAKESDDIFSVEDNEKEDIAEKENEEGLADREEDKMFEDEEEEKKKSPPSNLPFA